MAKYYQDFVGLNTLVYEPSGWFTASQGNPILSGSERKQYRPDGVPNNTVNLEVFQNQIGRILPDPVLGSYMGLWTAFAIKNFRFPYSIPIERSAPALPKANASASYFNALMTKRNGPYGFPSWKQIRISQNPLSRAQRRNNIFTYVREPGNKYDITINNKQYSHLDRFGPIRVFTEPIVAGSYKPLAVVGSVRFPGDSDYFSDDNSSYKTIAFSTTLGNETVCFANTEVNEYYDTVDEGNENYEDMKELYLGNAIEEDKSPFDRFDMLVYRQTVWPKMKNSYLNKTRSRVAFVNKFWRDKRANREENDQEPFDVNIFSQSMWPLDAADNFTTLTNPLKTWTNGTAVNNRVYMIPYQLGGAGKGYGATTIELPGTGSNSFGGPGILQNSYCNYMRGLWMPDWSGSTNVYLGASYSTKNKFRGAPLSGAAGRVAPINNALTAACVYSLRHTVKNLKSIVGVSGMLIHETGSQVATTLCPYPARVGNGFLPARVNWSDDADGVACPGKVESIYYDVSMNTSSLFRGDAFWDAPKQSGITPFYDSYSDFAANIRLKGQGYSIIPEFRISSHVEEYESLGVTEELKSIFEISGATVENFSTWDNAASASTQFYEIYSNSDFLQHFELIKKDHEGFVDPGAITLRCKAIKKFLPYKGFYPADRCAQMAVQFYESYKNYTSFSTSIDPSEETDSDDGGYAVQSFLQSLFAPGVLFNSIKAGIACDYPIITATDLMYVQMVNDQGRPTGSLNTPLISGPKIGTPKPHVSDSSEQGYKGSVKPLDVSTIFSKRVPFEALVDPSPYLANEELQFTDPHPFAYGSGSYTANWDGNGDNLYKKMMHNFLAEVPAFFLPFQQFSTIVSKESRDPAFGNAVSGNFYAMRVKMYRSTTRSNDWLKGFSGRYTQPPQDVNARFKKEFTPQIHENFTMYSRPSAFGPPSWGSTGTGSFGPRRTTARSYPNGGRGTNSGIGDLEYQVSASDSMWGNNYPYTPPYYHGEAWCDLIFECTESRKYTADEIISAARTYPYYSRHWWPGQMGALRDLTGYRNDSAFYTDVQYTDMMYRSEEQGVHYPAGVQKHSGAIGADWNGTLPGGTINGRSQYNEAWGQNPSSSNNAYYSGRYVLEGPYSSYGRSPWAKLISKSIVSIGPFCQYWGSSNRSVTNTPDDFPLETMTQGWGVNWGTTFFTDGAPHSASWASPPYVDGVSGDPPVNTANFWGNKWRKVNYQNSRFIHEPQHPFYINTNAMQLDSTLNLFGRAMLRSEDQEDHTDFKFNVATEATNEAYTRWCIQPKFETPMFNFNKYSNLLTSNCTSPLYASESVPRGMWHQYGEVESDPSKGIFMQVSDLPYNWMQAGIGLKASVIKKNVKSLADLCGFNKKPVKLGQTAGVKRISEAVVAVPFYQKDGRRQFFTIPRRDIEDCKKSLKYEAGDTFKFHKNAAQTDMTPQTGRSVYEMVKKMTRFSIPPSMDFVQYNEIDPFAMYLFEFTHDLKKQDLANIWQNLPPDIGTSFQEAEVSLSHQLLADELMGGGADIQFRTEIGMSYDPNTEAREPLPGNIQWMVFKVKRKAETNYFDKVVGNAGVRGANLLNKRFKKSWIEKTGPDQGITYNWPYDYFSLVELVKLDAEITFAEIERKDGRQVLKKKIKGDVTKKIQARAIPQALGKARMKKE